MRRLELLAPARNLECGMAAIDHGADAVYIGASRFGARVAAGNSIEDIGRLCTYAHQFGARVYVTVNTLVYDDELSATFQLLDELSVAGADAILVQDMAVAGYIISHPQLGLGLHASTQTDNRTARKVGWLAGHGFSRVVLARELSLDDIAAIHSEHPDVELEVFVHGALCVSYSGLCYASQLCFGRSANRGECAQFCRMKFDLIDSDGCVLERQRHLLSLKDMNRMDHLETLALAGVTSFKIEGRLKDLTYVKNVTAAYSQQLNRVVSRHPDLFVRSSRGTCVYQFSPDLHKSFNRGYTDYFLHGRQPGIASFDTPKATGEYVGKVKELRANYITVAGLSVFANGDGLCFLNDKRELEGFRVNRVEGNRLFLPRVPQTLRRGTMLFRNNDQQFETMMNRATAHRRVGVTMSFETIEEGFRLTMDDVSVTMQSEHVKARTPQRENVMRQLTKLGDTPYECTHFQIADDFDYFIPVSQLSDLRRRMVACYTQSINRPISLPRLQQQTGSLPEPYSPTYLYNIANRHAARFYEEQGIKARPAFELEKPEGDRLIMQCRHCLRYALGFCVKYGGRRPEWHEPLYLVLADGRHFRLEFDCHQCQMNVWSDAVPRQGAGAIRRHLLSLLFMLLSLLGVTSCYQQESTTSDAWNLTERQVDSISFYTTHHYTQNYNFRVKGDSLQLIVQHPTEVVNDLLVDTISVVRGDHIVVADITRMPADTIDTVWVKVARDQQTIGWVREGMMLAKVEPDTPISRFIDVFSDTHLLIFLAFFVVVAASYLVMFLLRRKAKMVHFNDIDSFYPTLLAVLVAASAVFYSTIQLAAPESWRHYYYHPTLNPFAVPLHLGLFLFSVWLLVIIGIATLDDLRRRMPLGDSIVYLLGLMGVCALNYVVFSISTLYYIGYPLLLAYFAFALWRYFGRSHHRYLCGSCGAPLSSKGVCPKCGAFNE